MAARSSIARLPQELADLCHRLIREGKTIHEITDKLNELDAEVSKSAVGRYVKSAREQMTRFREAQEVAGRWVAELGENSKGDVATLCQQMLTGIAFQTLDQVAQQQIDGKSEDGKPAKQVKAMDLMLFAKALESLESSNKRSIERREKIERAVIERAAKKVGEIGAHAGISQASIDRIQQELRLL
jgi:predicted transcriptional regulator